MRRLVRSLHIGADLLMFFNPVGHSPVDAYILVPDAGGSNMRCAMVIPDPENVGSHSPSPAIVGGLCSRRLRVWTYAQARIESGKSLPRERIDGFSKSKFATVDSSER